MKMNMHLVRDLLVYLETFNLNEAENAKEIQLKNYTNDEIVYHIALLVEGGYIDAVDVSSMSGVNFIIKRLTFDGHQFLALMQDKHLYEILGKVLKGTINALPVLLPYIQPYIPQLLGVIK